MRVIAIDWSGARTGAERRIWLAEVVDDRLVRLENGRSREEIAEHLVAEARRDPKVVIGFDFAFSLPQWYLDEHGFDARGLWEHLSGGAAELWLSRCEPPFWGRPGRRRPALGSDRDHYRRTEREVKDKTGFRPKSVFQVGGAGAVGTGSLRGMPILRRLKDAGFSVWPFDPPGWPRIVEIYPRLLTEAVRKSDAAERAPYLSARHEVLDDRLRERAASSEDAFDAAISALVMHRYLGDLFALPVIEDRQTLLEGMIWHPSWRSAALDAGVARG